MIEDPETKKQTIITPTQPPESYGKTNNNLVAKATVKISKTVGEHLLIHAPQAVLEAGEHLASGAMAGAIGAVKVVRSNNKKRAAVKALPHVGIAMIPGVGLPRAIGLGVASSHAVDKVYKKVETKDRRLELKRYWPSTVEFFKIKGSLEEWTEIYNEVVDSYFGHDPMYYNSAQEVIGVIFWLLRSLTKLRENLLLIGNGKR